MYIAHYLLKFLNKRFIDFRVRGIYKLQLKSLGPVIGNIYCKKQN